MKRSIFLVVVLAALFVFVSCGTTGTEASETAAAQKTAQSTDEAAETSAQQPPAETESALEFDAQSTDIEFTEVAGIATREDIDNIYGTAGETQMDGDILQYLYRNVIVSFMENEDGEMVVCGIENFRPASPFLIGGAAIAMDETEAQNALAEAGYTLQGTTEDGFEQYIKEEDGTLCYITVLFEDSLVSQLAGWYGQAAQMKYEQ
jgi:hypothetical protein